MTVSDANDSAHAPDADTERVWRGLVAAARLTRKGGDLTPGQAFGVGNGRLIRCAADDGSALFTWEGAGGWTRAAGVSATSAALLDLYLPLCNVSPDRPAIVGHLGQSLDGNVATASGDSYFITGPANLLHLHRMRALCDAVIVGAGTVAADDPRLTTRRAEGAHPVRVILDPQRRLSPGCGVFQDGAASTLLVCDAARAPTAGERTGSAEVIGIRVDGRRFDLAELVAALHDRELYSVFVEGGGRTVSLFLEADLLDRLQVAIAPLVTGAGRRGLDLPARDRISECLRPPHRVFAMGDDVLFDCDLRAAGDTRQPDPRSSTLSRIL